MAQPGFGHGDTAFFSAFGDALGDFLSRSVYDKVCAAMRSGTEKRKHTNRQQWHCPSSANIPAETSIHALNPSVSRLSSMAERDSNSARFLSLHFFAGKMRSFPGLVQLARPFG